MRLIDNFEIGRLDTNIVNGYNILCAEVAQSVEQRTENPRVPSSILGLGTKLIRCKPKWRNGIRDSLKNCWGATSVSVRVRPSAHMDAELCSGSTGDFESSSPGSNPGSAATRQKDLNK